MGRATINSPDDDSEGIVFCSERFKDEAEKESGLIEHEGSSTARDRDSRLLGSISPNTCPDPGALLESRSSDE